VVGVFVLSFLNPPPTQKKPPFLKNARGGPPFFFLATPFAINERATAKDYDIQMELMYRGESKTILFRLSLRKFDNPSNNHTLMSVEVDYTNTLSGRREKVSCVPIAVMRRLWPSSSAFLFILIHS